MFFNFIGFISTIRLMHSCARYTRSGSCSWLHKIETFTNMIDSADSAHPYKNSWVPSPLKQATKVEDIDFDASLKITSLFCHYDLWYFFGTFTAVGNETKIPAEYIR